MRVVKDSVVFLESTFAHGGGGGVADGGLVTEHIQLVYYSNAIVHHRRPCDKHSCLRRVGENAASYAALLPPPLLMLMMMMR